MYGVYPFVSICNCPAPSAVGLMSVLSPTITVPYNFVSPTTSNFFAGLSVPIPTDAPTPVT